MKHKIIALFILMPWPAFAEAPSTSCPSEYITIDTPEITIATTCPSGTVSLGSADSCLAQNPSIDCWMYAPVGMSFTDNSGTYEFTDVCTMD
ncbi:MAG: hypothetical protein IJD41_02915 [Alphaproteobacteria bacterium]|nr:hypothetical protein [Alphaproteobacteria bacterium]MBQ7127390.1 hypothetical protein [Alphaproteobacteria bacterium]